MPVFANGGLRLAPRPVAERQHAWRRSTPLVVGRTIGQRGGQRATRAISSAGGSALPPLAADVARAAQAVEEDRVAAAASALAETAAEAARQKELFWAAVKLPIYSVAVVPVLVGASAAYAASDVLLWGRTTGYLLCSCLVIAWLNLSNDGYDAETGVDARGRGKPESVVTLLGGNAGLVLVTARVLLAIAALGLALLTSGCGDGRVAALLVAAIACGHVYQAPPHRLGYRGLGEPLAFLAFGPLATSAFYFAHMPPPATALTPAAAAAGVLVGLSTAVILFCSHFHQVEGDVASGKLSPVVRLGTAAAARVLPIAPAVAFVVTAVCTYLGHLPLAAGVAVAMTWPLARRLVSFVAQHHADPTVVKSAKYHATKWHMALGGALTAGLAAAPIAYHYF